MAQGSPEDGGRSRGLVYLAFGIETNRVELERSYTTGRKWRTSFPLAAGAGKVHVINNLGMPFPRIRKLQVGFPSGGPLTNVDLPDFFCIGELIFVWDVNGSYYLAYLSRAY